MELFRHTQRPDNQFTNKHGGTIGEDERDTVEFVSKCMNINNWFN